MDTPGGNDVVENETSEWIHPETWIGSMKTPEWIHPETLEDKVELVQLEEGMRGLVLFTRGRQ